MNGAVPGISAVLSAVCREDTLLDLAAVLDGLVGGSFEIVVAKGDERALRAMLARHPGLPVRATDVDVASAVARATYDLVLLTSSDGELDLYALNHFFEAIEGGADLAIGYRPWTLERLLQSAFGHLVFGNTGRDVDCPFKLFRRVVWQRTLMEPHSVDRWFSTRLVVRARRLGFRVVELPVPRARRRLVQAPTNALEITG